MAINGVVSQSTDLPYTAALENELTNLQKQIDALVKK